ncbi:MAG: hypothetical protein D6689_01960 [Deltaproteobacteria bacterium]|nr:MAG: hypothetical protein D6689_01960 [Deltaproteobacteria bacterium]
MTGRPVGAIGPEPVGRAAAGATRPQRQRRRAAAVAATGRLADAAARSLRRCAVRRVANASRRVAPPAERTAR